MSILCPQKNLRDPILVRVTPIEMNGGWMVGGTKGCVGSPCKSILLLGHSYQLESIHGKEAYSFERTPIKTHMLQ